MSRCNQMMNIVPSRDAVYFKSNWNNANINVNLDKCSSSLKSSVNIYGRERSPQSRGGGGAHLKEDGEGGRGNVVIERVQECQAGSPALNERSSQELLFFPSSNFAWCLPLLLPPPPWNSTADCCLNGSRVRRLSPSFNVILPYFNYNCHRGTRGIFSVLTMPLTPLPCQL